MDKNLLKQYKFVYYRNSRNLNFVNAEAAANYDKEYPKVVIANKIPDIFEYSNKRRCTPTDLRSHYDARSIIPPNTKSLTKAEWYKVLLHRAKKYQAECRKEIRNCEKESDINDITDYLYKRQTIDLSKYVAEVKEYKRKVAEFEATGIYTYLELMK